MTDRNRPLLIEVDDTAPADPGLEAPVPDTDTGPEGRALQAAARLATRRMSGLSRLAIWVFSTLFGFVLTVAAWDFVAGLLSRNSLLGLVAMVLILQVSPWYAPQYIIPILGLILGNSLTAISLTTGRLIDHLHSEQAQIRTLLSLSATPFEACHSAIATAISSGMMPTINSMMVVGVVSLPGMMTGQILAGADPTQAVRYQIITMFFICAGSALSCTLSALFVVRRFFNYRMQLVIPK